MYCNECARNRGLLPPLSQIPNLTGSTVVDKFLKHTQPPTGSGLVGVFADPSYENVKGYYVETVASGSCNTFMVDGKQKVNAYLFAGRDHGILYRDGKPTLPTDACVVPWVNDDTKVHVIPYNASDWKVVSCQDCGKQILSM